MRRLLSRIQRMARRATEVCSNENLEPDLVLVDIKKESIHGNQEF